MGNIKRFGRITMLSAAMMLGGGVNVNTVSAEEVSAEQEGVREAVAKEVEASCNGDENLKILRKIFTKILSQKRFFGRQIRRSLANKCGHRAPLIHSMIKKGEGRWLALTVRDIWVIVGTPEEAIHQVEQIIKLIEITLEEVRVIFGEAEGEKGTEWQMFCVGKTKGSCNGKLMSIQEAEIRKTVRDVLRTLNN